MIATTAAYPPLDLPPLGQTGLTDTSMNNNNNNNNENLLFIISNIVLYSNYFNWPYQPTDEHYAGYPQIIIQNKH